MWMVCETLCGIIGSIDDDPHISVSVHEDKYKAFSIMREFFSHEVSRDDLGALCYAKFDDEKMMAKICFEQTVIVILVRYIENGVKK